VSDVDTDTDISIQVADAVDDYLRRTYDDDRRRQVLEKSGWDPTFSEELAGLEWYSLAVPESQGGLGAPLSALGPVFMHFGRYLVAGPSLENALLPALLQRPDDWASAPAIAAAVRTGVPLALVDPGITDDWADDVGTVLLTPNGLRGAVNAVRFARQAQVLVVIADSETGPAVCLVDATEPGVTVDDVDSADPTATLARVTFADARVIGAEAAGHAGDDRLIHDIRSWTRILIACELSGIAQRCLDRTIDYIRQREQFGRAIGSFQAIKHIAADMYTRSTALHNLCIATLADAGQADQRQLYLLGATAKAYASSVAVQVCEDAIQLHGGIGFTTENELSWYYKRTLALRGWYGDKTELERRIGAALLEERFAGTDSQLTSLNSTSDPMMRQR
jgi:alkylation response protein AidB-like acyl-CoA dehydrogenase